MSKPDWCHFGRDLGDQSIVFHEPDETQDPPVWRGVTKAELVERLSITTDKLYEAFLAGVEFGIQPDRIGPDFNRKAFERWLKEYESER